MNAITEPVFGNIPMNLVHESVTNPRKHFDPTKLQDLMNSIKSNGLGQPILVRPHPDKENAPQCVEIVAGARRFRASQLAGLETIPAVVRDMTDREVLEFQLVENLQREDVHEIEEAEGYQSLMANHNMTADDVAATVGKSRSYVYGRLKLCGLASEVRDACFAGTIEASTALLIARIPVQDLQVKAAQEITKGQGHALLEPMSYRRAKEHIRTHYMLDFNRAPFMISDSSLVPAAGACGDCPKRTGNQPELFSDLGSADVCTDSDCWFSKTTAHGVRILKEAESSGLPIQEVNNLYDAKFEDASHARTNTYYFDRAAKHGSVADLLDADQFPDPIGYAKTPDGRVHAYYSNDAMQTALEKAGICKSEADEEAEEKAAMSPAEKKAVKEKNALEEAKKAAADLETKVRVEVYKRVRLDTINKDGMSLVALRAIMKYMISDYSMPDLPEALDDLYSFDASDSNAVCAYIDQAGAPELEAMMLDMFVNDALQVATWKLDANNQVNIDDIDDEPVSVWLALAEDKGIDIDAVRAELAPPQVEEKPAAKKAKKAGNKTEDAAVEAAPAKAIKSKKKAAEKEEEKHPNPSAAWPFPTGKH